MYQKALLGAYLKVLLTMLGPILIGDHYLEFNLFYMSLGQPRSNYGTWIVIVQSI